MQLNTDSPNSFFSPPPPGLHSSFRHSLILSCSLQPLRTHSDLWVLNIRVSETMTTKLRTLTATFIHIHLKSTSCWADEIFPSPVIHGFLDFTSKRSQSPMLHLSGGHKASAFVFSVQGWNHWLHWLSNSLISSLKQRTKPHSVPWNIWPCWDQKKTLTSKLNKCKISVKQCYLL